MIKKNIAIPNCKGNSHKNQFFIYINFLKVTDNRKKEIMDKVTVYIIKQKSVAYRSTSIFKYFYLVLCFLFCIDCAAFKLTIL